MRVLWADVYAGVLWGVMLWSMMCGGVVGVMFRGVVGCEV